MPITPDDPRTAAAEAHALLRAGRALDAAALADTLARVDPALLDPLVHAAVNTTREAPGVARTFVDAVRRLDAVRGDPVRSSYYAVLLGTALVPVDPAGALDRLAEAQASTDPDVVAATAWALRDLVGAIRRGSAPRSLLPRVRAQAPSGLDGDQLRQDIGEISPDRMGLAGEILRNASRRPDGSLRTAAWGGQMSWGRQLTSTLRAIADGEVVPVRDPYMSPLHWALAQVAEEGRDLHGGRGTAAILALVEGAGLAIELADQAEGDASQWTLANAARNLAASCATAVDPGGAWSGLRDLVRRALPAEREHRVPALLAEATRSLQRVELAVRRHREVGRRPHGARSAWTPTAFARRPDGSFVNGGRDRAPGGADGLR